MDKVASSLQNKLFEIDKWSGFINELKFDIKNIDPLILELLLWTKLK